MALQVNTQLTTRSGFTVPSGAYVWVQEAKGADNKYSLKVRLLFYINKTAFEQGKSHFLPEGIETKYERFFSVQDYANITSTTVHNFLKQEIELVTGNSTVSIVA
jgi:hypothetical protein